MQCLTGKELPAPGEERGAEYESNQEYTSTMKAARTPDGTGGTPKIGVPVTGRTKFYHCMDEVLSLHDMDYVGVDTCSARSVSSEISDFLFLDRSLQARMSVSLNGVGEGGPKVLARGPHPDPHPPLALLLLLLTVYHHIIIIIEGILKKWNFFKLFSFGANFGKLIFTYI